MRDTRHRTLSMCAWLALIATVAGGADWPRFRGPDGSGLSAVSGLPLTWSETENVVWRTFLPGPGTSSPVVVGKSIFLTCYSGYGLDQKAPGEQSDLELHLLCIDAENGTVLWDRKIGPDAPKRDYRGFVALHGYASSTPAVDEHAVYCFWGNTGVSAWSHDGKPLWTTRVGDKTHSWGSGPSPILHGNLVIVNASVESGDLIALDRTSGQQVWRQPGMEMAWNTPIIATAGGRDELVISVRKRIKAFAPATGTPLWNADGIHDYICPAVVAHDGIFYAIGARQNTAVAIRGGGADDVTASHTLWRMDKGSNVSSPVYYRGHLYWANDSRGMVYCVDAKDGTLVYEEKLQPRAGRIYASPLVADERIYYVTREAGTFVVAAKPVFEQMAHNVLASDNSVFNASAVPLAPGRLLLRSDQFLTCIGKK